MSFEVIIKYCFQPKNTFKMKKNNFYLLQLVFIIVLFFSCKKNDENINIKPATAIDKYNFPVKPGTSAWANLKSGQEMVDACQVPESVLKTISTEGLMETCLDYPLLLEMLAYNNLQYGTQVQLKNFNGFVALNKRPDAGTLLFNHYKKMNPDSSFSTMTLIQKGAYSFKFTFIEMILAQDEYLQKLSINERKTLIQESLLKYQAKSNNIDIYGTFGHETSAYLMARIMLFDQYQPFVNAVNSDQFLKGFVTNVLLQSGIENKTLNSIVNYSKNYK